MSSSSNLVTILGAGARYAISDLPFVSEVMLPLYKQHGGRLILFPDKNRSKALVCVDPTVIPFISRYGALIEPRDLVGSVFISAEYARHHDFRGMVVPFDCARECKANPVYLITELRGGKITGWAVVRGRNVDAIGAYVKGYEKCEQGGPDQLCITAINDTGRLFEGLGGLLIPTEYDYMSYKSDGDGLQWAVAVQVFPQ